MTNVVSIQYDQMKAIGARFRKESERVAVLYTLLVQKQGTLRSGSWIGRGSDSFNTEMVDDVLPALRRLIDALNLAGDVSDRIVEIIVEAEQEAAGPFDSVGDDEKSAEDSGSGGGSGGGSSGGSGGGSGSGSDASETTVAEADLEEEGAAERVASGGGIGSGSGFGSRNVRRRRWYRIRSRSFLWRLWGLRDYRTGYGKLRLSRQRVRRRRNSDHALQFIAPDPGSGRRADRWCYSTCLLPCGQCRTAVRGGDGSRVRHVRRCPGIDTACSTIG